MNTIGQHWNIKHIQTEEDFANYVPSETIQPNEKYDFYLINSVFTISVFKKFP